MRLLCGVMFFIYGFAAIGAPSSSKKTLRVRSLGEPVTLDWNLAYTSVDGSIIANLMEGLVDMDSHLKIVPGLAESWTTSADKKTYTFKLRKGIKWSDGKPLTAQHFLDGWKRLLSPLTASRYAYWLYDIEGAEDFSRGKLKEFEKVGVRALDARTLEVRLRAPVAYWIWIPTFWATYPVRLDIIQEHGANWTKPGNLATVGPFVLSSHDVGRNFVLKRNPHYAGKRGNLEEVVVALIKEDAQAVKLYQDGGLDYVFKLPAVDEGKLRLDPGYKTFPAVMTMHLDFHPDRYPTSSVHLRRALAMAIDREKLAKRMREGVRPGSSLVPPQLFTYDESAGLKFDPTEARKELAKAGVGSQKLTLELVTVAFEDNLVVTRFLQEEFKKHLGIELKVNASEPKFFYSSIVNFRDYHLILSDWRADFPDPDNFYSIFMSDAGTNKVQWKSPDYDALIQKARVATSREARRKLYLEAEKILLEKETPTVPLYYGTDSVLMSSKIKGGRPRPIKPYTYKDLSIR